MKSRALLSLFRVLLGCICAPVGDRLKILPHLTGDDDQEGVVLVPGTKRRP